MNESRDIKDIESIYTTINENSDNKVWKDGDCPEALGDSKHATDLKPEEPCSTPNNDCVTGGAPLKPEDSDDENTYYMKKISERLKEKGKKSGKIVPEQINNFETMSDKEPTNIFDKLYDTIMEGDNPFDELDGMNDELDASPEEDAELDIGGDDVTLSLPRDLAEQLCDALKEQLGEAGGEEGEDPFGGGGEEDFLEDAVESKPEPTALGGHGDREHPDAGNTGAGSNKVSGAAAPDAGNADTGSIKDAPTPTNLGGHGDREHPDAGKVSAKSNEVKNPKTKAPGQ